MDALDIKILRILQEDSSLSVSEGARQVGLSSSPCWKRINRLVKEGVILRQNAVLSRTLLDFGLTAYVSIKTGEHTRGWLTEFSSKMKSMPEVVEVHRMAGEVDYMLKVVTKDIESFDRFYKGLIKVSGLNEVTSRFSMEAIKETTSLPI